MSSSEVLRTAARRTDLHQVSASGDILRRIVAGCKQSALAAPAQRERSFALALPRGAAAGSRNAVQSRREADPTESLLRGATPRGGRSADCEPARCSAEDALEIGFLGACVEFQALLDVMEVLEHQAFSPLCITCLDGGYDLLVFVGTAAAGGGCVI